MTNESKGGDVPVDEHKPQPRRPSTEAKQAAQNPSAENPRSTSGLTFGVPMFPLDTSDVACERSFVMWERLNVARLKHDFDVKSGKVIVNNRVFDDKPIPGMDFVVEPTNLTWWSYTLDLIINPLAEFIHDVDIAAAWKRFMTWADAYSPYEVNEQETVALGTALLGVNRAVPGVRDISGIIVSYLHANPEDDADAAHELLVEELKARQMEYMDCKAGPIQESTCEPHVSHVYRDFQCWINTSWSWVKWGAVATRAAAETVRRGVAMARAIADTIVPNGLDSLVTPEVSRRIGKYISSRIQFRPIVLEKGDCYYMDGFVDCRNPEWDQTTYVQHSLKVCRAEVVITNLFVNTFEISYSPLFCHWLLLQYNNIEVMRTAGYQWLLSQSRRFNIIASKHDILRDTILVACFCLMQREVGITCVLPPVFRLN